MRDETKIRRRLAATMDAAGLVVEEEVEFRLDIWSTGADRLRLVVETKDLGGGLPEDGTFEQLGRYLVYLGLEYGAVSDGVRAWWMCVGPDRTIEHVHRLDELPAGYRQYAQPRGPLPLAVRPPPPPDAIWDGAPIAEAGEDLLRTYLTERVTGQLKEHLPTDDEVLRQVAVFCRDVVEAPSGHVQIGDAVLDIVYEREAVRRSNNALATSTTHRKRYRCVLTLGEEEERFAAEIALTRWSSDGRPPFTPAALVSLFWEEPTGPPSRTGHGTKNHFQAMLSGLEVRKGWLSLPRHHSRPASLWTQYITNDGAPDLGMRRYENAGPIEPSDPDPGVRARLILWACVKSWASASMG